MCLPVCVPLCIGSIKLIIKVLYEPYRKDSKLPKYTLAAGKRGNLIRKTLSDGGYPLKRVFILK